MSRKQRQPPIPSLLSGIIVTDEAAKRKCSRYRTRANQNPLHIDWLRLIARSRNHLKRLLGNFIQIKCIPFLNATSPAHCQPLHYNKICANPSMTNPPPCTYSANVMSCSGTTSVDDKALPTRNAHKAKQTRATHSPTPPPPITCCQQQVDDALAPMQGPALMNTAEKPLMST